MIVCMVALDVSCKIKVRIIVIPRGLRSLKIHT